MNLKLISNWKTVLKGAWSMLSTYVIIIFSAILQMLPLVTPNLDISVSTVSLINMGLGVSVVLFRIIDQQLGITPPVI